MIMTLADGRKFDTTTKQYVDDVTDVTIRDDDDVSYTESFTPIVQTKRRLEDLPTDARQMNAVCAVLAYTLMGIDDGDIALAMRVDVEQIDSLKRSDPYRRAQEMATEAFVNGQNEAAAGVLANAALPAARALVTGIKDKNAANRIRAAESILTRNGIGADGNQNMNGKGLLIRIVKDADTKIDISL